MVNVSFFAFSSRFEQQDCQKLYVFDLKKQNKKKPQQQQQFYRHFMNKKMIPKPKQIYTFENVAVS